MNNIIDKMKYYKSVYIMGEYLTNRQLELNSDELELVMHKDSSEFKKTVELITDMGFDLIYSFDLPDNLKLTVTDDCAFETSKNAYEDQKAGIECKLIFCKGSSYITVYRTHESAYSYARKNAKPVARVSTPDWIKEFITL